MQGLAIETVDPTNNLEIVLDCMDKLGKREVIKGVRH